MLLDPHSASLAPPARRWHRPPKAPLPPEPGRLQTNALVNVARHQRGCKTRGDDRLETRAYAVKRLLWRWGHAQRSGHYACSIWQLVDGLAPIMGWGERPTTSAELLRWHRAHAENVRRWLEDLQRAGVITFTAEDDNRGQDWRTLITLHRAPEPPEDELRVAEHRKREWAHRRRHAARTRRKRRARRVRPRGQRLELVSDASQRPQKATRRRLAIDRACALRERRAAADATPHQSPPTSELRTDHFVAVPSAQHSSDSENEISGAEACSDRTGVTRARVTAPKSTVAAPKPAPQTASMTEGPASPDLELAVGEYTKRVELAQQRVAAAEAAQRSRAQLIADQAAHRAAELADSPADRGWPAWRVQEAFVVWRRGAEFAGERHAGEAGPLAPGDLELLARTAQAYEEDAIACPVGWPECGYAALERFAELARGRGPDARPQILHHAIRELALLAEQMHAIANEHDPDRHAKQVARARRRRQPPSPAPDPLRFHLAAASPWPHWAALDEHGAPIILDEHLQILDVLGAPTRDEDRYRDVLRDAYLAAGLRPPPHADGRSARADRGTHDPASGRRRAQPPPYHAPGRGRDQADPADVELARLTKISLRAAQRLDVDELDRRLHNARAAHADQARDERDDFWQRIQNAAAVHEPRDTPPGRSSSEQEGGTPPGPPPGAQERNDVQKPR